MGCLGRQVVTQLRPGATQGRAGACDSTPLATGGGVWPKKPREHGVVPHSSIDPEAGWSKSGWPGWWDGWKLHVAVTVGSVWIPLAAELTGANRGDTEEAPLVLEQLPEEVRSGWGDTHDNPPELRQECHRRGWELVAPRRGPYPHCDGGVEVRQVFHTLRAQAIEPFNGVFKNVFEWRGHMPVKGLQRSQLLALGAVILSQLVLLYQHERNLPLGKSIKPFLRAA